MSTFEQALEDAGIHYQAQQNGRAVYPRWSYCGASESTSSLYYEVARIAGVDEDGDPLTEYAHIRVADHGNGRDRQASADAWFDINPASGYSMEEGIEEVTKWATQEAK